ncbi:MAG: copper-binding protein [Lautropia sp.]
MNFFKTAFATSVGLIAATGSAWAAGSAVESGFRSADTSPKYLQLAQADVEMSDGVVRKIDKENKKITLRHGEIKNLDMPGMTMVFAVQEPAVLESLKTGDKVRFSAEKQGETLVVTRIESKK